MGLASQPARLEHCCGAISHQWHHSAERLDTWGAFWFSPLDMVGWTALFSLALTLVGLSPAAVFATVCVDHLSVGVPACQRAHAAVVRCARAASGEPFLASRARRARRKLFRPAAVRHPVRHLEEPARVRAAAGLSSRRLVAIRGACCWAAMSRRAPTPARARHPAQHSWRNLMSKYRHRCRSCAIRCSSPTAVSRPRWCSTSRSNCRTSRPSTCCARAQGIERLRRYFETYTRIALERTASASCSRRRPGARMPTGRAKLGYDAAALADANRLGVGLLLEVRDRARDTGHAHRHQRQHRPARRRLSCRCAHEHRRGA